MKKLCVGILALVAFYGQNASAQLSALCNNAAPICAQQGLTYASPTGQPSLGTINCLISSPNPNWFYLQVGQSGNIDMLLTQTNPNGTGIDVDFMLWGPFATVAQGCTSIGNNVAASNQDCSFSAASVENVNITNGVTGQYYILLVTNYSQQPGTINLIQNGGSGSTNCGVLSAAQNNGPICLGEQLVLTANGSSATGSYSFAWYLLPNFSTVISTSANFASVPTAAGNYTYAVIVTDNFSLESDTAFTSVTVNPIPPAPNFDITSPACAGQTVTMTPNPALPAGTVYNWSGPSGYTNNLSSVTFNNAQTFFNGTYTLQVTINGCQSPPFSNTLTIFPVNTPVISGPAEGCEGNLYQLTVTPSTFVSYEWNGFAGANPQLLFPGTYTVEATDANGCVTTSAPFTMNIIPNPLSITGDTAFCEGTPITLQATAGKQSYSWNTGSNAETTLVSSEGTVSVTVVSLEGCVRSDSVFIRMYDKPVAAYAPLQVCDDSPVVFSNQTQVSDAWGSVQDSWLWNFGFNDPGNGNPVTSTSEEPTQVFPGYGNYPVSLTVETNFGCKDTFEYNFLVIKKPEAAFTYESLCFGEVLFTNTTELGTYPYETVSWDFGDGAGTSSSQDSLVFYTYPSVSGYTVSLSVTDTAGCASDTTIDITVEPTPLFDDLPNVLTPNGDGVNDSYSFPAIYDKCYNYIFSVFNRWGAKVFETESSENGFAGISNLGSGLQDGVYFWILVGNGVGPGQGQEVKKSGTISVVGTK